MNKWMNEKNVELMNINKQSFTQTHYTQKYELLLIN